MSRESEPRVSESVEHLFRHRAGQMVSTLTRVFGVEQLDLVEDAVQDAHPDLGDYYPAHATRGDLLTRVGRRREAVRSYRRAIELTASAPVRRLLERRSQRALSACRRR